MNTKSLLLSLALSLFLGRAHATEVPSDINVERLVAEAQSQLWGKSLKAKFTMEVTHATDPHTVIFQVWSQKQDKTALKVLAPPEKAGSGVVKVGSDVWQYSSQNGTSVKVPDSEILQNWMGSDFALGTLVRASNLSDDYVHEYVSHEVKDHIDVAKMTCVRRKEAPAGWNKLTAWVRVKDAIPVKEEFYSDAGELVKTLSFSEIKKFGSHSIPTLLKMTSAKTQESTTIRIEDAVFDESISKNIFKPRFLKKYSK